MPSRQISNARRMRKAPASTERDLWRLLRGSKVGGLKFRRQAVIGPYIVDFACMRHRLVIEADGPFHNPEKDAERDAWLEGQGFRVIRMPNAEINRNFNVLIERILALTDAPLDPDYLEF
jgi:very-short-patch-repair endonuclease